MFYILHWVCWVIDWLARIWVVLACRIGLRPRRFLHACVRILADSDGRSPITIAEARAAIAEANRIYAQCNVTIVIDDISIITSPDDDFLDSTTCEFGGLFSAFFAFFSSNALGECVTLYFVENIEGACGCSYPGANWATIATDCDNLGCIVAHEIGHLSDLWGHSDDEDNLMSEACTGGTNLTEWQCCLIRTNRFTSVLPRSIGLLDPARGARV